ncbi:MAG: 4Fe-4S dicluster domain-containing protein, partial [Acidimicrobiia bacterium]|nr:4Fe-4S dicluster domain-containing protein [Acidimicrobiia bacterium]
MTATVAAPAAETRTAPGTTTAPFRLYADPLALPLRPGEQYRFAVDLSRCIGCHACEVACAEQNDLPAGVYWRKVGDVEGGEFPHTARLHVSTACNHCLEPACMHGCPTLAYSKGADGIVVHDAQACVGCGYCTWNCPYDVPVIDPVCRIATKCDMCKPRLDTGDLPACVESCPTGAIALEIVDVASWRADHAAAEGPGLPPSGLTLSTTRIAVPAQAPR